MKEQLGGSVSRYLAPARLEVAPGPRHRRDLTLGLARKVRPQGLDVAAGLREERREFGDEGHDISLK